MSELVPFSAGLDRDSRRAARVVRRGLTNSRIRQARVDDETDVTLAKVEAVTAATGTAMSGVVRVAQAQKQLEQMSPEASGRLNFLADAHSMAMGDLMQDLRRELRRK